MLKRHQSTPVHLLMDNAPYFITGSIYQKRPLLRLPELKQCLLEHIRKSFSKYDWKLYHWVILDNHYHLMAKSKNGKDLSKIVRTFHTYSAIEIRKATGCEKPVWFNYWDYCPRDEKDYMTRLNYLLYNPVKHGYVRDLKDYPFSSFHKIYVQKGRDNIVRQFKEYAGYRNLEIEEDSF